MTFVNDATSLYLQQIQPHDLADLMTRIHHDMLLDSFTAQAEQLEFQLSSIELSDDIAANFQYGIRTSVNGLRAIFDDLQPDKLPAGDVRLIRGWQQLVTHDLRAPISVLSGWVGLLQEYLDEAPASAFVERAQRMNREMQSTTERMSAVSLACLHPFPPVDNE